MRPSGWVLSGVRTGYRLKGKKRPSTGPVRRSTGVPGSTVKNASQGAGGMEEPPGHEEEEEEEEAAESIKEMQVPAQGQIPGLGWL